jgi:hypothetical protein
MASVLSQAFFGAYEFIANIIPGTLIIVTCVFWANLVFTLPSSTVVPESVLVIFLIFLAFIAGLAIQGISAYIEKHINKRKYGGYPSSLYLDEANSTFPKYFKDRIRDLANKKFGTPIDASSSHVFDLCYTYVVQKNVSARVSEFLRVYTFSRNMIVTMIIEAVISFCLLIHQQQILYVVAGFVSIALFYIFYKRFLRYSECFAKEVYRSFLIDEAISFPPKA